MVVANFVIFLSCLWLVVAINYRYLQPALRNRHRFKLYRLRDELSLLAMRGIVNEESEEFQVLVQLLNAAIRATGTFQVTDYLHFLVRLQQDKNFRKRIEQIRRKVDGAKNPKYCRIASETFHVLNVMLRADTTTLRLVFLPIMIAIAALLALVKVSSFLKTVEKKQRFLERADHDLDAFSNDFDRACFAP